MPHTSNILPGPKIAPWNCPSCREAVPRLLPNGQPNRVRPAPHQRHLPLPEVEAALQRIPGLRANEICYACGEAYQELLGTLVRPPGEIGDAHNVPGLNDTGIIGALVPVAKRGTQILIFHVINGALCNTEVEALLTFNPDRLTYPGSRGAIAPLLWEIYQRHLAQLREADGV